MNPVLLTLGGLTLGGCAAVILLSLAGRTANPRYGAKWRCWAWAVLCLRLAVPLPLLPQAEERAPIQVDVPTVTQPLLPGTPPAGSDSVSASSAGAQPVLPEVPSAGPSEALPDAEPLRPAPAERVIHWSQLLAGLWLAGSAALLVWNGAVHLRFLSYLRRWSAPVTGTEAITAFNQLGDQLGLDRRPRMLVCQGLKVPMLAGLLRPAILLPPGALSGQALGFSLLHELTHYRRRDIWLKSLAMWVSILHWFNPLMWYMVRLVERDTELACDEEVLRRLPQSSYAAYGQTILDAVAQLQNRALKGEHNE